MYIFGVYFWNRHIWFISKDEEVTHDVAEEDEYPAEKTQLAEDDEPSAIEENDGQ